jgi:hypothetical protein
MRRERTSARRVLCAAIALSPVQAGASSLWFQQNAPAQHDYGRQLALPAGFGDAEFTLELWLRPDHTYPTGPTSGGPSQLVNWSDADNPPYSGCCWWYEGNFLLDGHNNASFEAGTFSLQLYGGGRIRWLFGDQGNPGPGGVWSVGVHPAAGTPSLLDGGWHQVTLVRRWSGASAASLEMWIDGRLVDTETSPVRTNMRQWWDGWSGFPAGQEGWFWGAEKQAAIGVLSQYEDYKGLLDEVRYWSRAKSGAEIAAGWRASVAPGALGLVGLYRFGEGTGGTTCDAINPAQCMPLVNMKPGYWSAVEAPLDAGTALRFHGNGAFEENQVKIRLDAPARPVDVGLAGFTLEFWMKAQPGQNPGVSCSGGGSDWINSAIVFDRDVFGNGDLGDFGVSLMNRRLAWGVGGRDDVPVPGAYFENTVCGSRIVDDGAWHHVAVTRDAGGQLHIFVDGQVDAQGAGPDGDASYRDGRPTSWPGSDPFLVIGAEKHFGATGWNGFSGWIDEVRVSTVERYTGPFVRPAAPFATDASTAALYHFDEGAGDVVGDVSGAAGGPSHGERHFGGAPPGPVWVVSDAPLSGLPEQTVTVAHAAAGGPVSESGGNAVVAVRVTTSNGAPLVAAATVSYTTVDGTATAPEDYGSTSGAITFAVGTPSAGTLNVAVPVIDDTSDEPEEYFNVGLSAPSGAVLGSPMVHTVAIVDNDLPATLGTGDCAVIEGNAGAIGCAFAVSLAPGSGFAATVAYATSGITATPGVDFAPASGTLTFPPGTTSRTVTVDVLGDPNVEPDETFTLDLSGPFNATIADGQGLGTIVDDDGAPLAGRGLAPGGNVVDDLAGGPDLYRLTQQPYASYEVVLDGASGDIGPGLQLERVAPDGSSVLQSGVPSGTGSAVSLRWENLLGAPVPTQYVRVRSAPCSSGCGADDVYRLRAYETTGAIARFNNAGGQVTVVLLQNGGAALSGRLHFWGIAGQLLHAQPFALGSRASLTLNTTSLTPLQGQSGSVTVTHDGPHGALTGKAVALDPAAGFSFDSPLATRPR